MGELIIGSHVSFTKDKQLVGSVLEALSYGANTFMFYTGAPQNTNRASISENLTREAYQLMEMHHIDPRHVIVHAPYIINLANDEKKDSYQFAITFLRQELERCEALGMTKLVLHPGSFVHLSREKGLKNIIEALNEVITPEQPVMICLETMAGKGSELGISLSEMKEILDGVRYSDHIMFCLDTCHLHDAGYDLTDFDAFLDEFDQLIGIDRIGCVHINDSKNVRGAHKDRHENIGLGMIGFDVLLNIIYHARLVHIPKILETPYVGLSDDSKERLFPPYRFEIAMIREKKNNPHLREEIREFYK